MQNLLAELLSTVQETVDLMARRDSCRRRFLCAARRGMVAAGVESAARWRIEEIGHQSTGQQTSATESSSRLKLGNTQHPCLHRFHN
jgi:hypothetical protein